MSEIAQRLGITTEEVVSLRSQLRNPQLGRSPSLPSPAPSSNLERPHDIVVAEIEVNRPNGLIPLRV